MIMIVEILVFITIYCIGFIFGYFISEKWTRPFGFFDTYPWMCRKCCTFWIMVFLYTFATLIMNNWWLFGFGMVISIAQAICFIISEREKGLR